MLERQALGLRDEEGGEDTAEHEEGVDLEDVVEPRGGVGGGGAADAEGTDEGLGDDGADFARGGGDAVRGGAVAGGEALAGDDEGGRVGAEVEEEVAEDVEGEEAVVADDVVAEAHDAEEDGEEDEAHELDGFPADRVDLAHVMSAQFSFLEVIAVVGEERTVATVTQYPGIAPAQTRMMLPTARL